MKLILENWNKYLNEISQAEIKHFGPAFEELFKKPQLAQDKEWVAKNIGKRLGAGRFRRVHEIANRKDLVFKIARDPMGPATGDVAGYMNWQEKETFNRFPKWFPKVFLTAEDEGKSIQWLVVEKVEVVNSPDDYGELLIANFPSLLSTIKLIESLLVPLLKKHRKKEGFGNPVSVLHQKITARRLFNIMTATSYGDPDRPRTVTAEKRLHELLGFFQKYLGAPPMKGKSLLQSIADQAWKEMSKGKLAYFKEMLDDVSFFDRWDIRPGNVGKRGNQLLLIDIYSDPAKSSDSPRIKS